MPEPLRNSGRRVALVTGGSRRIGRAISEALAREGYVVLMHARRIEDHGPSAPNLHAIEADLASPDEIASLVPRAAAAAGSPLTLLVNNASVFEADEMGDLERARWDRHFAVNLAAPVFLAQAFAQQAPDGVDASIVNITDQRSFKPVPRQFTYTLTKCALDAATVMLAQALAPRVRVNAVAPGPTLPSPRQDSTDFATQQAALPLTRGPTPDDIAAAVLYLVSARAITGTTIAVDGGQHIAWKTPDAWGIAE